MPPQNLEAEENVLGAMMITQAAIVAVREVLNPGDFYRDSHARIYRATLALHDASEPVDAITLTAELERRGDLEAIGGKTRIYELARLVPTSTNARHYAELVRDMATLRGLIRAGTEIAQLGWDREGAPGDLAEKARRIAEDVFDQGNLAGDLQAQTWNEFERDATEHIPMLVGELWPEGGLGFIAAPPKKGKTWVGLDLAIAVATGTDFLNIFPVPQAAPVIYVGLEGHKAAIRGRIGALTRGRDLDPGKGKTDLQNLHVLYKPVGLNLNDPAWTRRLHHLAQTIGARLIVVDVLRAAAVLKENSNDDFRDLVRTLQPITTGGCALALLHHFTKLTELSKERTAGERMAGAGAMYGAIDVGVFIVDSKNGARFLEIEFETRDLPSPDKVKVFLEGQPGGPNGGFTFNDAPRWVETDHDPDLEDRTAASAAKVKAWLEQQPDRRATATDLAAALGVDRKTLTRRRQADSSYEAAGIVHIPRAGKIPSSYYVATEDDADPAEQLNIGGTDPEISWGHSMGTGHGDNVPIRTMSPQETPDLQGEEGSEVLKGTHGDTGVCPHRKTASKQGKPMGTHGDTYYVGELPADADAPPTTPHTTTTNGNHPTNEPEPTALEDDLFQ